MGSLDIWKTEMVLRRSKIVIATGIQIAVSSVGAAYYGQHLHTDLHPYRFRRSGAAESDSAWDTFRCDWPKKINRLQIQDLFRLSLIDKKANVIFLVSVGLGSPT
jgi:hypothetical protein